jgi:FkbM family methyltransferase
MLISELLPMVGGIREVVDITPEAADLLRQLRLPEGLRHERYDLATAEKLELGPGSLLVALLGSETPEHTDPDDLAPVLRRMRPRAHALMLTASPASELPRPQLLELLVDSCCQLVAAAPIDEANRHGVRCALLIERVNALAPPDADPTDFRSEDDGRRVPDDEPLDELRAALRIANERLLGDKSLWPQRRVVELGRRVADLDRELAERGRLLAEREAQIAKLKRQAAEHGEQLRESERQLARVGRWLAALQSSLTFQTGQVVVEGVRHPAKAVVTVPVGFARLWRARRARREAARNQPPARPARPATQVVPIALPSASPNSERAAPELLTITAPAALHVPRRLAESGLVGYENSAMACFLAVLDVAGPGAVLDIGANVGLYAGLASALTSRPVWAFEPAPELVEVARRFAVDNGLDYTIEALALGAENGSATFYLSSASDTSHSLAAGFRKSSAHIKVPVETLDSYVARTGAAPAIMKVDTETTEPDVLAGAATTIAKHRPWIFCEVLAGRVETRLTEVLSPFGYHWFQITSEVPYPERDRIVGDRTYEHLMWLFVPDLPDERFWAAVRSRTAELAQCTVERTAGLRVQVRS